MLPEKPILAVPCEKHSNRDLVKPLGSAFIGFPRSYKGAAHDESSRLQSIVTPTAMKGRKNAPVCDRTPISAAGLRAAIDRRAKPRRGVPGSAGRNSPSLERERGGGLRQRAPGDDNGSR